MLMRRMPSVYELLYTPGGTYRLFESSSYFVIMAFKLHWEKRAFFVLANEFWGGKIVSEHYHSKHSTFGQFCHGVTHNRKALKINEKEI